MAIVVLAEDTLLGRQVALKQMTTAGDPRGGLRLRREALIGASISHPNLVSVYDVLDSADGDLVVVMEYVEGETLARKLDRERSLAPPEALRILGGVAAGLDAIHRRSIVHRDVKPPNILLGSAGTVKLADLGVASMPDHTRITSSGAVVGSLRYMAPEQVENAPSTKAIDVYALAAVAFEALSGRKARREANPLALAHAIATRPAPDLREAWPQAPAAAAELLARAMSRNPAERPASAGELVDRLGEILVPQPTRRMVRAAPADGAARAAPVPPAEPADGAARVAPVPPAEPANGAAKASRSASRRPAEPAKRAAAAPPRRPAEPAKRVAAPPPRRSAEPADRGAAAPPSPPGGSAARTFSGPPPGRSRRGIAAVALLALLVGAVVAIVLVATSGGGSNGQTGGSQAASQGSGHRQGAANGNTGSSAAGSSSGTSSGSGSATSGSQASGTSSAPASSSGSGAGSTPFGGASQPVDAVESFYRLAAAHNYSAAWALADPTFRSQLKSYQDFAGGQQNVKSVSFDSARVVSQTSNTATVALRTTSTHTDGAHQCAGTADLARSSASGSWQLHQIHINCT